MHTKGIRILLRECTIFNRVERKEQRQAAWQKIINLKHDVFTGTEAVHFPIVFSFDNLFLSDSNLRTPGNREKYRI